MGRWDGRVVWITGGGTGLGRGMAVEVARQGAKVAVSGRRLGRLEEVVSAIEGAGGEAMAVVCDVTREDDLQAAVDAVVARFGQLDVAIANAGCSVSGAVEDLVFDADGTRLYAASRDGVIRTYLLDIDDLVELATSRVDRAFTDAECERYLREPCPAG